VTDEPRHARDRTWPRAAKRNILVTALAAALLTIGASAYAQDTTGSVTGIIVDAQGLPVPGVTVTVTGPQGAKTAVTEATGRFSVPFLVPGTYSVRSELQGFKSVERQNVTVGLGQTVELNLKMEVGGVAETVQVSSGSPVIDTSTTTIGANIDSELLSRLPVGRRFSDTLYVAPGVSTGGTVGEANPSISGGSGLENQYVVDGVNITNQGYGALGSYSIVFGSLGNGTPFDFMKEVQIKSGGFAAEYGQATGGVVNVVTKSGTNNLRGTVFGYVRPSALESSFTQVSTPNGTVNTTGTELSDVGLEAGGPLLKDRVFLFGAIDPQWERRTFIAPDDVEHFPLRSLGEVDRDRQITSYAVKGTWQATQNHRFDASFFGDPAHGDMGPQRTTALLRTSTSGFSELDKYGGHNQTVRYDGILGPNWLIEASFARAVNEIVEIPSVNEWSVTDQTVTPNIISGGIGFFEQGNRGENFQYAIKSTNIFGNHQLKYGLAIEDVGYDQINNRTGPTFTLVDGTQTATGATIQILPDAALGRIYRVTRANLNTARETEQLYTSFFVQDTWRVSPRLTILPGLRYEQQDMRGTLVDSFKLDNNWAPRIGVTWDPTGEGRWKVFGNYGTFYYRVPNDLAARALSSDAGIGADYFDANLTQPIPDGVLAGGTVTHFSIAGAGADAIDPDVKSSYLHEVIGGVEYELWPGTRVGARYIHRNIARILEDVTPFPIVAANLGVEGAESVDYTLTNVSESTLTAGDLGASFEKPIHRYDAVELTMDRRFANNWGVQASYRWSRLRGTFEGAYRDDNGQSDPGITSLFDFPTNDPSYTAIGVPEFGFRGDVRFLGTLGEGPLPLDRTHQIKVYGNYTFNFGLNAALGMQFSTGKPLTPFAANPNINYQNGGEIPECARGCGIDTVDGFKTRTPFLTDVSAHVDYGIRFTGTRRIVLLADIFNLFNTHTVLDYDNWTESTFGALNPNFGQPTTSVLGGNPPQKQTPRQIRLGARFEF
jgi:outer membrane receptor protein involved in Fe transport